MKRGAEIFASDRGKSRERGPLEFKSHLVEREGDLGLLCRKDVITVYSSTRIEEAIEEMVRVKIKKLPVIDAGTKRLLGMVTSYDIADFLGGGEKHNIITKRHNGNYLSAINEPVREIMASDIPRAYVEESLEEAMERLVKSKYTGMPVLDENDRVVGIITERDFIKPIAGLETGISVRDVMTEEVLTLPPGAPLIDAMRAMVRNVFRRIPITSEGSLLGIITTIDIQSHFIEKETFSKIRSSGLEIVLNEEVSRLMTKEVITVSPDKDVGYASKIMLDREIGGLPVLSNGELVGIVTEKDVISSFI